MLPALLLASRFFVMGDGTLSLVNAHTDDRATVHYRRKDGTYAADELARLRHVVRSQGDAREIDVSLRLVEVLSWLEHAAGGKPLVVLSGYRSPDYNQGLKAQGKAVAGGSLHTEGLATDLAFPRDQLPRLWHRVRDLDCWEPLPDKARIGLAGVIYLDFQKTDFEKSGAEKTGAP